MQKECFNCAHKEGCPSAGYDNVCGGWWFEFPKELNPSPLQRQVGGDHYARLRGVLDMAYEQAASGKGKERHATDNAFEDQPICTINRMIGSIDGCIYQVVKKTNEAKRLLRDKGKDAAIRDILGAMVYQAAIVVLIEDMEE